MKLVALLVIATVGISGCANVTATPKSNPSDSTPLKTINQSKVDLAVLIAGKLKTMESINPSIAENYEVYKSSIQDINKIIRIINENTGTSIPQFELDLKSFENFRDFVRTAEKYAPIIDPYNELIASAKTLNSQDDSSVNLLYTNMLALGLDVGLLQANLIHKGVFKVVGNVNNELKLAKLRGFCGNSCYSATLSKIYDFGKQLVIQGVHDAEDILRNIIA